jgi:hypothetical protein
MCRKPVAETSVVEKGRISVISGHSRMLGCNSENLAMLEYSSTTDYEAQESRKTGIFGELGYSSANNGLDGLSQGLHGRWHGRECASAQRQAAHAEMPIGLAPKNVRRLSAGRGRNRDGGLQCGLISERVHGMHLQKHSWMHLE